MRRDDGRYLGHVHENSSMANAGERVPDESVARTAHG
jgi:hypothetical protein